MIAVDDAYLAVDEPAPGPIDTAPAPDVTVDRVPAESIPTGTTPTDTDADRRQHRRRRHAVVRSRSPDDHAGIPEP